jgi:triacylglycerol lipase
MTTLVTIALLAGSLLMVSCGTASAETAPSTAKGDYVVLLHGLGRTAASMKRAEWFLKARGYRVINETYPSRQFSIEQLADGWLKELVASRISEANVPVHFVTHSLGGIVLRQYLSNHKVENLGRVVMLAPPNHGSAIMDRQKKHFVSRKVLGPAGEQLGTSAEDAPARLGPVDFECGVIAGNRSLNPFLASALSGPNDGKVTVESAKIAGMRDFIILPSTHTWIGWRARTLAQVLSFLRRGAFERELVCK